MFYGYFKRDCIVPSLGGLWQFLAGIQCTHVPTLAKSYFPHPSCSNLKRKANQSQVYIRAGNIFKFRYRTYKTKIFYFHQHCASLYSEFSHFPSSPSHMPAYTSSLQWLYIHSLLCYAWTEDKCWIISLSLLLYNHRHSKIQPHQGSYPYPLSVYTVWWWHSDQIYNQYTAANYH